MLGHSPHLLWLLCMSTLLLSAVRTARADEKPCTVHANGNYYDLNRLTTSKGYEFNSTGGHQYILNVCKPLARELWSPKVDKPEEVAGFTRRQHGDFSIGDANTTVVIREGQPLIFMTDGSRCPNAGELAASTAIRFICDESAGVGKPNMIATLPLDEDVACAFFVEWRTEMACPTSEGSVFGTIISVLAIIAAIVFAVYIVGGTLYNRYVLELRGMDQIPRFSFFSFSDTVEFVQDCMRRVRGRSVDAWQSRNWGAQDWGNGGSWGNSGRYGYSGLRATPEESRTMLGGPPGFLDEQDDEDEEAPHPQENSRPMGMDANGVIRL